MKGMSRLSARPSLWISACAGLVILSVASSAPVVVAQQAPKGQQRAAKELTLKEACPGARQESGASGNALEPAQRAVEQMKACMERLITALNEKPDKDSFDNDLKTVIDSAQASVNLLKGQDGLLDTASKFLNRLKSQRDDIPRKVPPAQREARQQELDGLIRESTDAMAKLDKAAKELNETIIELNSQRPEIAYSLSVDDTKEKVGAINRAVDIINNASKRLNDIGKTLGAKPGS